MFVNEGKLFIRNERVTVLVLTTQKKFVNEGKLFIRNKDMHWLFDNYMISLT